MISLPQVGGDAGVQIGPRNGHAVLVVEDSRAVSALVCARLGELDGVQTFPAYSRAEARELLAARADDFFVAVLDLNLPDAPGGEVVELVQAHGVPVVVLTGAVDEAQRQAMFARNVADYIVKSNPVGVDYVVRLVERMRSNRAHPILVVDDSPAYRAYLETLLGNHGYPAVCAGNGREGLERLADTPGIRLVVTDFNMPEMDGLEMVGRMRALRSPEELAIVAVSTLDSPAILARFLKNGASDFLRKPFGLEEFYCRIDQNLDMVRYVQEARDAANRDFLTRVYNRRFFFEQGERIYRKAVSDGRRIAVAMVDADHFKRINDTWGHQAGDAALLAMAQALSALVGQGGILARFGGEEFVCLLEPEPAVDCAERMEALRAAVAAIELSWNGAAVPITASIGWTAQPLDSFDAMLARADAGVYEAKAAGRNRVVML